MHGFTFWIERNGRFTMVDAFIADFDKAEAAALAHAGGGTTDSYTRRSAEWMGKLYREPGRVKTIIDATPNSRRGAVKRGSRADTAAERSVGLRTPRMWKTLLQCLLVFLLLPYWR